MITSDDALANISISLAGLQAGLYFLLLILCLHRLCTATPKAYYLLQKLHILTTVYIVLELGIQFFQMVTIIMGNKPEDNAVSVLALNVFCLICDLHILILLTIYWEEMEGSFAFDSGFLGNKEASGRFVIPVLWFMGYLGFFLYLAISGNLTLDPETLSSTNQLVLFILVQSITQILLIIASIWQLHKWRKLDFAIQSFSHLMSGKMNKTRVLFSQDRQFLSIFWSIVVFNFLRILFISYLAICSYQQNYKVLIISLNAFTLSALVPIGFYLFGFKIKEETKNEPILEKQDSKTSRSQSHETELSHHSQKMKNNYT